MAGKNIDDNVSKDFEEIFNELALIGVHDTLEGNNNVDEIPYMCDKKDEQKIIDLCNRFQEKYDKKLNYEFREGLCYFSYP